MDSKTSPPQCRRDAILEQRDRLFQTPGLQSSRSLRKLLEFLLDKTLSEVEPNLKEYVIAVEVFDRSHSFDPKLDPIVRVHASRLRSKLRTYFSTAGAHDPILISLPERGYCPVIQMRRAEAGHQAIHVVGNEHQTLNTVVVRPFAALGPGLNLRHFSQGLTDEIVSVITHYAGLRVVEFWASSIIDQQASGVAILQGRIRQSDQQLRICTQLIDPSDHAYLWSQSFTRRAVNSVAVQRNLARSIMQEITKAFGLQLPS
jgi:TolB-like protein